MIRCEWAQKEKSIDYHDHEWGIPVHDDKELFEFLILEGAQAGLSWSTILARRENYRQAFDHFDPQIVSAYDPSKIEALLQDSGIIRNRLKIKSAVSNAQNFLKVQAEFGSFNEYIWSFVGNKPIVNQWKTMQELPAKTPLSEKISKDLKKRGFNFVGPTIVYAFMQAVGMVNDHTIDCFRYQEIKNSYS
ncbi:MAG: DNA-3-methyladenine glycosylase I [Anaerolineaceae bacterium]|nr:DNA-3-methyladenine glycosylase I [Anaerolineaceae bacterium]